MRKARWIGRTGRWGLSAALGVVLAAMAASVFLDMGKRWSDGENAPRGLSLQQGRFVVWKDTMFAVPNPGWYVEKLPRATLKWRYEVWDITSAGTVMRVVIIPLWWAAAGLGLATMLAWGLPLRLLPSRRRAAAQAKGVCWKCGYDVRGIEGACPECGSEP